MHPANKHRNPRGFRLAALVAPAVAAALAGGAAAAQDPVFRTDTRLVVLHATVVDKSGHW